MKQFLGDINKTMKRGIVKVIGQQFIKKLSTRIKVKIDFTSEDTVYDTEEEFECSGLEKSDLRICCTNLRSGFADPSKKTRAPYSRNKNWS